VPDPISSAAAGGRPRRTVLETPPVPRPRPRRSRLLLVGLPMFAVFAAFGAIVWLAYEHGSQGPPVGEPPLVKAPSIAIKLGPEEGEGQDSLADGGEVLDMLSDAPPTEAMERLLPPPEEPLAPVEQASEPPEEAAAPETETASTPPPAPATSSEPPAEVATLPAEPQTEEVATPTPAPTPEEAEAALDALLAEVTQQAERPRVETPAPSTQSARVESTRPSTSNSASSSAEVRPAVAPPAPVSPFGRPAGEVTAIAPDRRPPAGSSASPTGRSDVAALDGPYRIQLAAVRDEADAQRAWDLFQVDLGPVLSGLEPFIERADTANGVFYRVQIGPFANLPDAEALCDQLKQRNASCFVIRR
jgi:cell division septation protein DedD